jgi:hypothetical protein
MVHQVIKMFPGILGHYTSSTSWVRGVDKEKTRFWKLHCLVKCSPLLRERVGEEGYR